MPLFHEAVLRAFRRHRQPVKLAREAYGEIADVDHLLNFAHALLQDFAHLHGDQASEVFFVFADTQRDLTHDLASDGRRYGAPF
ncbi:hypothetical protein SDC9_118896 [bioreactor metagenome]|uniref:Uncharacterized protein n=1 Tax=bioreactor metagenome TaxID=1076179 RepID=A0A645C967_9ZZZZ